MTTRRGAATALALGLLGSIAACGLPDDRTPRIIAAEEAPLDLREAPDGNGAPASGGDDEVEIYLVRNGLLEQVSRASEGTDLATAIELLLEGTTDEEEARGFRTVIPLTTRLLVATHDGSTAVIDLGCEGEAAGETCGVNFPTGQDLITTFAQLTCTATAVPGIDGVRFLQEGAPQDVSTSDGGSVQSPEVVTCEDYRSLLG